MSYGNPPEETRFNPGQSGNPNGRPRGASLKTAIRRWLDMEHGDLTLPDGTKVRVTKQDEMIRKQILKAIDEQDTPAFKTVMEFAHDKAIQRNENLNTDIPESLESQHERLIQEEQELTQKLRDEIRAEVIAEQKEQKENESSQS